MNAVAPSTKHKSFLVHKLKIRLPVILRALMLMTNNMANHESSLYMLELKRIM